MTRHDPPYVFFPGPVPGVSQTEGKAYYDVLRVEPSVKASTFLKVALSCARKTQVATPSPLFCALKNTGCM